ncbi:hypothetical protein TrVE_jg8506 [Triparma verrucosa]|uniref:Uncharacterized protein n=1 Tax=Triparma verrucosa TaxID=1606542 RepID=A0A9W7C073_9STRA|nr:hypothetical protein TrVE_jg8506 [Triparma verrucosa]
MVDLITDIYMTVQFFTTEGQEGYGRINAWLIGLTIFGQILVSYLQNRKKLSVFFQDAFFTLIGFRPGLDAYRVRSGSEQEDHHVFTPLAEMTWCKCIEMVLEAIPASIVQVYALLLAKEKRVDALVSIIISAATIAFSSSMLSYDWDTSPANRNALPFFYGFVPDKALTSFVSARLYSDHYDEGGEDTTKVSDDTLKAILASLYSVWFISGVVFMIKREYLHTFISLETESDKEKRFFVNLRDDQDEAKSSMFSCHPDVYKSWGDELMKPWTLENWSRWEEEKPAWFTDTWIESVPNNYIPYDWRVKYNKTKGRVDP